VDDPRLLGHELKYAVAVASRVTEELASYFAPGDAVEGRFTQLGRALVEADQIAEALLGNVQRVERLAPAQSPVDVDALLTQMRPSIVRAIDPAITLSFRLSGERSTVFATEEELVGVIRRLVDGAVDAMPSGGELSVSTGWMDHVSGGRMGRGLGPRRYLRVSVADTGAGHYADTWQRVPAGARNRTGAGHLQHCRRRRPDGWPFDPRKRRRRGQPRSRLSAGRPGRPASRAPGPG
jgi:signal transduction histidine kinase